MAQRCADEQHDRFEAEASVIRLSEKEGGVITHFRVDVRVRCTLCDTPFQWIGLPNGISPEQPTRSLDGLELSAPVEPQYTKMRGTIGFGMQVRMAAREDA